MSKTPLKDYNTYDNKLLLMLSLWLLSPNRLIGQVDIVFANAPGDLGSIPGRVIPKRL